jgi:O-acetyl-ADP-ribose deacetylase (regulator of RNase III)
MIKTINKNIIFAEENIIAHGCNCQGKMNSGVAKAVRQRWPFVYSHYYNQYLMNDNSLPLGQVQFVGVGPDKYVANCMTQKFYGYTGGPFASLPAIKVCLLNVAGFAKEHSYSVALPPIGCGLGGLSWSEVGPIVEEVFILNNVKFNVYDYTG